MAPETRKTTMDSLEDQIRTLTQQMEALIRRQDDQNQINHNQNQLLNKRLDEQSRKHDEIITQLQKSLDESAVERSQPLQQIPTETRISAETGNNCVLKPLSFSPKIECPKFDGTNPRNWIDKCGRYFELCKVLEYQKVDIASLYIIGKAEDWMCSYMSNRRGVCWNEFVDDLFGRFRDESGTEVVEQFNKLCQSGDLDTYVDEFEHYKSVMKQHNHVLPDAYLLDSFIGGLKPAVRPFVRAFKPVSITQAIRYARLQEETLLVSKNTEMFPLIFKPALSNIKPPILPTPELFDESPKKEKLWQQYANNGMQGQVGEGEAVHLTLEVLNAISQEERKKALRRLRLNVLIFDPGGLSFVGELVQVRAVAVMGGLLHIFLFMCLCGITASFCGSKPSEGVFVGAFLTGLLLAETEFPLQLSFLLFFVVCISMALTLWLAAGSQLIASHFEQPDVRSLLPVESMTDDLQDHIIMCGFGRVGQIIAQLLSERLIPFVTLDVRSDRVAVGRALDLPVYFGDTGSREMLHKVEANNGWQGSLTTGSLNFKKCSKGQHLRRSRT